MQEALVFNIVALFAVFIITLFIMAGDRYSDAFDKFCAALGITWIAFCISCFIWCIYVAAHFIGKYW